MKSGAVSLGELSALAPGDFVRAVYDKILQRSPTPREQEEMLSELLGGDARTWLVGKLRYGAEGRIRGVEVPGLRMRYIAQRLFRVPGIGPVLAWINALVRLPSSLRHLRAVAQLYAERSEQVRQADLARIGKIEHRHDEQRRDRQEDLERMSALERRHDDLLIKHKESLDRMTALERRDDDLSGKRQEDLDRVTALERRHDDLSGKRQEDLDRVTALERRHDDLSGKRQEDLDRVTALERRHDDLLGKRQEDLDRMTALERRHDDLQLLRQNDIERIAAAERRHEELLPLRQADQDRIDRLENRLIAQSDAIERDRVDRQSLDASVGALDTSLRAIQGRLDAMSPPALGDVLEIPGLPLVSLARERFGLAPEASLSTLTRHQRYAMFETVFYESPAVSAKQRVYVPYLDRELARNLPFLDLGCGRGEFLRILRDEGIAAVGVDINPTGIVRLRAEGFDVVEQNLLTFLEVDRRTYCGASLLQVAEHLTDSEIEKMLALVAARLAPGGVFILETPNPLSGFALGVFHTDSTHLRPLPPERMRYEIEAAGFEQTRTLFQARIPSNQYAGQDPRAYYADYAIIAVRTSPPQASM